MLSFLFTTMIMFGALSSSAMAQEGRTENPPEVVAVTNKNAINCLSPSFQGVWDKWSHEAVTDGYMKSAMLPLQTLHFGLEWGQILGDEGYDWTHPELHFSALKQIGRRGSFILDSLENYPSGLSVFSDEFKEEYIKSASAFLERYSPFIDFFWVNNEVNLMLESEGLSAEAYVRFYNEVRIALERRFPDIRVGTIVTYPYESKDNYYTSEEEDIFTILEGAHSSSLIGFTYYPQFFGVEPVEAAAMMHKVDDLMKDRNMDYAILETGWSSDGYGSSEQKQAEFHRALVVETNKENYPNRKLLCTWGLFDPELSFWHKMFLFSPGVITWLENLGLFDKEGNPKPAWYAYKEALK